MHKLSEVISFVLLIVFAIAGTALLLCAVAGYVDVWRAYQDDSFTTREQSMFVSNWFFYLNALVCFSAMLGLILYI
jgi:hypothetical protein